jgi:hypothetical protein
MSHAHVRISLLVLGVVPDGFALRSSSGKQSSYFLLADAISPAAINSTVGDAALRQAAIPADAEFEA